MLRLALVTIQWLLSLAVTIVELLISNGFYRALSGLAVVIPIVLSGCSNATESSNPMDFSMINRKIFLEDDSSPIRGLNHRVGHVDYFTCVVDFNKEGTSQFLSGLKRDLTDCVGIVLFESSSAIQNDTLESCNISALATYTTEGGQLSFRLFIRDNANGEFIEHEKLSATTPFISSVPLKIISNQILPYESSRVGTVCVMIRKGYTGMVSAIEPKSNPLLAAAYLQASKLMKASAKVSENLLDIDRSKAVCGPGCQANSAPDCEFQGSTGNQCVNKFNLCNILGMKNSVDESYQVGGDTSNVAFDSLLMRNYRDSSLRKTDWGGKMVSYYYYCWTVLDTVSIPLEVSVQTARVLYKYNTQVTVTVLGNPTSTSQLVSAPLKSEIVALLNQYRGLSANSLYQGILDDLEDDLNTYYSYTVVSFLAHTVNQTNYVP